MDTKFALNSFIKVEREQIQNIHRILYEKKIDNSALFIQAICGDKSYSSCSYAGKLIENNPTTQWFADNKWNVNKITPITYELIIFSAPFNSEYYIQIIEKCKSHSLIKDKISIGETCIVANHMTIGDIICLVEILGSIKKNEF